MVIAYAQSARAQSLDAAIDGDPARPSDPRFAELRRTAAGLNTAKPMVTVGSLRVSYGNRTVRMELHGSEEDATALSPLVIVARIDEILSDLQRVAALAIKSVEALDRSANEDLIVTGFTAGRNLYEAARARRRIIIATAAVAIATAATVATRYVTHRLESADGTFNHDHRRNAP